MEFSDLECGICSYTYSEDHQPRLLPCSHTFCGPCIDGLILAEKKECPLCRKTFTAGSAADVAINRSLLNVARQLSSMHLASEASSSDPNKSILEFTKDFRENVIGKGITDLQATEAEIKNHIRSYSKIKEGILEKNKGIARHIQMMKKMQLSNEKSLTIIEQNIKLMNTRLDSMLQEKVKLCDIKVQLKAETDFASAGATMGEAGQILHGAEKTVSEIKQLLQENDRQRDDLRQDTLRIRRTFTDAMKDLGRIIEELEGDSAMEITVADLRSSHGHLRGDAPREIFAVMTFEGKLRVAPVKIETYVINNLEEGRLPPRCYFIELESLMQGSPFPSPSSLPRAFLDLAYESTHLGRIIIRVTEGLNGLKFLYMCAGGMGPSYANSQVLDVGNKGEAGEWIRMGAYVPHGGGGGGGTSTRAALSSREDWERESQTKEAYEKKPYEAGDVRGSISYEGASQFVIITRDHPSLGPRDRFGKLEKGLDVLRDAILKYPDFTQVRVAKCGLIL